MTEDSHKDARITKGGFIAMTAIVLGLLIVAVYANWQNLHRDVTETTTVTRFTPTPTASPSPSP